MAAQLRKEEDGLCFEMTKQFVLKSQSSKTSKRGRRGCQMKLLRPSWTGIGLIRGG